MLLIFNDMAEARKIIQAVQMKGFNTLFIIDFNTESNILSFKRAFTPDIIEDEIIDVQEPWVKLSTCEFHVNYLHMFVSKNIEFYPHLEQQNNGNNTGKTESN